MERPKPAAAPGVGRPDQPLGRGLEQLSRVFLSQEAGERVAGTTAGRPPGRPLPRQEPAQSTLLLEPAARVTREQVAAAVKEFAGALEDGLAIIDGGIPCAPCGEIDFLAVDRMNQLAVVDFETTAADELLIRGLAHTDWVRGNVPNLRRMFRGHAINFSLPPKLFLLAPELSPRVRCAARLAAGPEIHWVRYHLLDAAGRPGIFFERVPAN